MEKSGFQCLLLGSVAKKQPRAEKVCKVRLDCTISKMSLTYRHLVWKAIRFKVPEYVDCTGSPRAERSTEIVTKLRSLSKCFSSWEKQSRTEAGHFFRSPTYIYGGDAGRKRRGSFLCHCFCELESLKESRIIPCIKAPWKYKRALKCRAGRKMESPKIGI